MLWKHNAANKSLVSDDGYVIMPARSRRSAKIRIWRVYHKGGYIGQCASPTKGRRIAELHYKDTHTRDWGDGE